MNARELDRLRAENETLRTAGHNLHAVLEHLYLCGLRDPDVVDALNAWDAAVRPDDEDGVT